MKNTKIDKTIEKLQKVLSEHEVVRQELIREIVDTYNSTQAPLNILELPHISRFDDHHLYELAIDIVSNIPHGMLIVVPNTKGGPMYSKLMITVPKKKKEASQKAIEASGKTSTGRTKDFVPRSSDSPAVQELLENVFELMQGLPAMNRKAKALATIVADLEKKGFAKAHRQRYTALESMVDIIDWDSKPAKKVSDEADEILEELSQQLLGTSRISEED